MNNQNSCATICTNEDEFTPAALDGLARMILPHLLQHLEIQNMTDVGTPDPKGDGPDMATKIHRPVTIHGRTVWIRANSEQEYAEKIMRLYAGDVAPVVTGKHDFGKYAMNWYETYSRPTVATATATTYKRQLTKYIIPHFEGMAVEDITVDDVQRLFNGMSCAKATKDKVKLVLSMVLDYAVEDELLKKNPVKSKRLKVSGKASQTRKPYSVEEMQYIVQNLGRIKSLSDRNWMALQALHPLRLGEVLGLKWEDVDMEKMVIHVRRSASHPKRNKAEVKDTKTAASVRDIPLTRTALKYLTPGEPGEFVCGGDSPWAYIQVKHMRDRIARDIGFDGEIVPARFRPTVLTDIYDQTKDIKQAQAAAGHTTAAMTLKHYVNGRGIGSDVAATVIDGIYNAVPS